MDPRNIILCCVLLLTALLFFFTLSGSACSYYRSQNQEVEEGSIAEYFIRITNDDHPLGVTVKIETIQSGSSFEVTNVEQEISFGEVGYVYYGILTTPEFDEIWTNWTASEKDDISNEYQVAETGEFRTTIIHHHPPPPPDPDDHRSNVFFGILGTPILITILFFIFRWRIGSMVFIPEYTLLKKDALFDNDNRRSIFDALAQSENGLKLGEIINKTDINIGTARHHLRILQDHGKIGETDHTYFVKPGGARKTFYEKILEARENGAITISDIARELDTSPQRVWYHVRKKKRVAPG